MTETWKDIEGYEGLYMVSNFGNVKSLNYRHRGYAKNLVPKTNNNGRLWVELFKDGSRKPMLIHRLVAEAFIPNTNNHSQINHIDENPKNNVVSNLEWCDGSYNMKYSADRHPERYRNRPWLSKPRKKWAGTSNKRRGRSNTGKKINQLSMDGVILKTWDDSRTIFLETKMSDWSISECCRGNRKTAYGFRWQYAT